MTEMTPADVPEEWMAVAIKAARWGDYSPSNGTQHDQLRRSLAAVLPLHEQQVREQLGLHGEWYVGYQWRDGIETTVPTIHESGARNWLEGFRRNYPDADAKLMFRWKTDWRPIEEGDADA